MSDDEGLGGGLTMIGSLGSGMGGDTSWSDTVAGYEVEGGGVVLNEAANIIDDWLDEIEAEVKAGLERTAAKVVMLARARAPVGGKRARQKSRNHHAIRLGFAMDTANTMMPLVAAGKRLQNSELNAKPDFIKAIVAPNASMRDIATSMKAHNLVLIPYNKRVKLSYDAQHNIKNMNGVVRDKNNHFYYGGTLRDSIKATELKHDGSDYEIEIEAHTRYAHYVEYGDGHGKAQPFLINSFMDAIQNIGTNIFPVK